MLTSIRHGKISTHTLRGERDNSKTFLSYESSTISTHTLRGERDQKQKFIFGGGQISTHTLRGERDSHYKKRSKNGLYFNSHAPWGA